MMAFYLSSLGIHILEGSGFRARSNSLSCVDADGGSPSQYPHLPSDSQPYIGDFGCVLLHLQRIDRGQNLDPH